jgi:uncharacterized protein (TIGR00730 family)
MATVPHPADHPSHTLAIDDPEFLRRPETRALRFALEFQKADLVLEDWRIRSTICMFGSARIRSPEQLAAGAAPTPHDGWYEVARRFARIVAERGGSSRPYGERDNVVVTGGGPGIMEAVNRGASEAGAPTVGMSISLPKEQGCNPFVTPGLALKFHYFAMRKMHLVMRANAVVAFPGGFGTFDEIFEVLTLDQTGKGHRIPLIAFGKEFWSKVVDLGYLADSGLISERDASMLTVVDDPEEGWEALIRLGLFVPD